MTSKQIPISSLSLGMYITKVDISWIDSPFMYHHMLIKSQSQIDKLLKSGVKQVTIDTEKGLNLSELKLASKEEPSDKERSYPANDTVKSQENVSTVQKKTSIDAELQVAKELMSKLTASVSDMNESLKSGGQVSSSNISPFIEETISSLQRNNQALITLINMQSKDRSLADHAFSTFSLSLSLSIKLKLSAAEKDSLAYAAFFHDVGWLKLPLNLLGKKSHYTATEAKLIQKHVEIGLKILTNQCDLSDLALRIISEHHELLNGEGYPNHLNKEQIHQLSKYFAVVVRYDEMIHGLADQPALTPNGALATLFKESKQGKFDEHAVSVLISLLSIYPAGSYVQLSNKEKGRVIEVNQDQPKLPKVKIYYDVTGTAHSKAKVIDLARQSFHEPLEIISVLDIRDPKIDPAHVLEGI